MPKKDSKEDSERKRGILILSSFGFALILILIFFFRLSQKEVFVEENKNGIEDEEKLEGLGEYFDKKFSEENIPQSGSDKFLLDDPFAETCAGNPDDGKPSISGNTICLR